MSFNKKHFIVILLALGIIAVAVFVLSNDNNSDNISTTVRRGEFTGIVYSSGQLQAQNSVSINAPKELSARYINLDEIKITALIEEGSIVDSGDYVATLDYIAVEEIRKTAIEELEKSLNELNDAKVDTGINLSNLRDELLNAEVTLEEKKLISEQSIYESPSVKRQAKLDVDRSQRTLEQKQKSYVLKEKQEAHKVFKANDKHNRANEKLSNINKLFNALEIKAPASGIVIYSYNRMGQKIKVGTKVSRYTPQIAELPYLKEMISTTFINEIDISKIKIGQNVIIGIDAFPNKELKGEVTSVANIGKIIPGGNAKVFEVNIKIIGQDDLLKPGMTSSNKIITHTFSDALYIPIECIFVDNNKPFVYLTSDGKIVKQEVKIGKENENFCTIEQGLSEGQNVLLNTPHNSDKMVYISLEESINQP